MARVIVLGWCESSLPQLGALRAERASIPPWAADQHPAELVASFRVEGLEERGDISVLKHPVTLGRLGRPREFPACGAEVRRERSELEGAGLPSSWELEDQDPEQLKQWELQWNDVDF